MNYREQPTAPVGELPTVSMPTVAFRRVESPVSKQEVLPSSVPEPVGRVSTRSLAEVFDPKVNSVNALRLVLAGLVLVSHTLKLHGGFDPIGRLTGGAVDMGTMAVDGFFALSGFLIVGSYVNSRTTGRYLWRRCLRILPGFWVCLLVSVFVLLPVAAWLERGTLDGFPWTGEQSALSYLVNNSALFIRQFEVTGLLGGEAVNGSLYTLFYEFLCYLGVAALGVVGLLRTRTWPLVAVGAVTWVFVFSQLLTGGTISSSSTTLEIALRFGAMFIAGAIAQKVAHLVPVWWGGVVLAVVMVVAGVAMASTFGVDPHSTLVYVVVAPPAVAYLVLVAGSSSVLRRVGAKRDLSYGLYVYAWPVQILLLLAGAAAWPVLLFGVASLVVALLMAWASWAWIESPALRWKSWTPGARRSPGRHGPRPGQ